MEFGLLNITSLKEDCSLMVFIGGEIQVEEWLSDKEEIVSDTHPSGQARGSRDLVPMVKSHPIQKYLKVCTNACCTVVSMNRIADVGYAIACCCFWPGKLFYGFTSCYCCNEERPEECAVSQNKKCCRVIPPLSARDQKYRSTV